MHEEQHSAGCHDLVALVQPHALVLAAFLLTAQVQPELHLAAGEMRPIRRSNAQQTCIENMDMDNAPNYT